MENALGGLIILDFSWVLAGPYATRLLADAGAEVLKIQPRLPEADDIFSRGYYQAWNRGKKGITLDPGKPQGRDIVLRLVGISDVVVENFSPHVMVNWGLDYQSLQAVRPGVIYLRLSAAGHTGPRSEYSAFAPAVHAFAGLTSLISYPGKAPLGPGFSLSDHVAGLYAVLALLGALEYRQKTGFGQYIDLSQIENMVSFLSGSILDIAANKSAVSVNLKLEGVYRCQGQDRWLAISCQGEKDWANFKKALGQTSAQQPKFSSLSGALEHRASLDRAIQVWSAERTAEEAMCELQELGIAAGVVCSSRDLSEDPQLKCRGFFLENCQFSPGHLKPYGYPASLSAPVRGHDNDYVFRGLLGMSDAEIVRLQADGII
jgi:benzylsuccinate CoA-transferase BbsF subunit